ncbi:male development gene 1, putative [Plasmodium chabaudi chabaudi]|uniref:Male development gene 1, putative n=1 Tax=Plasmodium chabaudi chabaudi TaxID=31271 RepID=A0A077TVU8_PLACU|nr:male development gene 1, putative [Plasmodium chabaudi chabaudi]SCM26386.1 male development gene 1, putative [Plasmodium chabaudi chabaudi]SCN63137.1 male development gene 1, putative [Plasmodium chabaudi chabaudi]VTZ71020.1 male development gene 1, putative [Plasmodium chabaudi chabaudi]|eukprot:XP_743595.1 male development gene 1, putative [Plasmodium chabaudi chabaudi]
MKRINIPTSAIGCLLLFLLSSQNAQYECMNIKGSSNNGSENKANLNAQNGKLNTKWSETGYNFMDLIKNGYVKNKDLDDIKDDLASELATKIQNTVSNYIKEDHDEDEINDDDIKKLKIYVKDISEYVGLKAADLLDKNLENALKPIIENKGSDKPESKLSNEGTSSFRFNNEIIDDEDPEQEIDHFADDLTDEYEVKQIENLEHYDQEINPHH